VGLNPFEARLVKDFFIENPCENLDVFFQDLKEVIRYGRYFNPVHHRVINWFTGLFVVKHSNKYDWNNYHSDNYVGPDRRSKVRDVMENFITSCKHNVVVAMMPKTRKIEHLKDAV